MTDQEEELGTVRWFGRSWGAPVCRPAANVPTPVGEPCAWGGADLPIHLGDQGVGVLDVTTGRFVWYHLDCWLRWVAGGLASESLDPRGPVDTGP